QRLVLNLADTLLRDSDDLANFFQSQRRFLLLLPVEAPANHRLLNVGQVGQIAIDDRLELIDALFLDRLTPAIRPVALLKIRLEFHREPRPMPRRLESGPAERLENRAAGVGREFESPIHVE